MEENGLVVAASVTSDLARAGQSWVADQILVHRARRAPTVGKERVTARRHACVDEWLPLSCGRQLVPINTPILCVLPKFALSAHVDQLLCLLVLARVEHVVAAKDVETACDATRPSSTIANQDFAQ